MFTSGSSRMFNNAAITEASVRYLDADTVVTEPAPVTPEMRLYVEAANTAANEQSTRAPEVIATRLLDSPVTEATDRHLQPAESPGASEVALRSFDMDQPVKDEPKTEKIMSRLLDIANESFRQSPGARAESPLIPSEAEATGYLSDTETATPRATSSKVNPVERMDGLEEVVTRILDSASPVAVPTSDATNAEGKSVVLPLVGESATSVALRSLDLVEEMITQNQGVSSEKYTNPAVLRDAAAQDVAPRLLAEAAESPQAAGERAQPIAPQTAAPHFDGSTSAQRVRPYNAEDPAPTAEVMNRAFDDARRYVDSSRGGQTETRREEQMAAIPTSPSSNVDHLVHMLGPRAGAYTGEVDVRRMSDIAPRLLNVDMPASRSGIVPAKEECFYPAARAEDIGRSLESGRDDYVHYYVDPKMSTLRSYGRAESIRNFGDPVGTPAVRFWSHPMETGHPKSVVGMAPQRSSGMVQGPGVPFMSPVLDSSGQPMPVPGVVDFRYPAPLAVTTLRPTAKADVRFLNQAREHSASPKGEEGYSGPRSVDMKQADMFCDGDQPAARSWGEAASSEMQVPRQPLAPAARAQNGQPLAYAARAENDQPLTYAARPVNDQSLAYAARALNDQSLAYVARAENSEPSYASRTENSEPSYASRSENGQPLAYAARTENSEPSYASRADNGQLLAYAGRAENSGPSYSARAENGPPPDASRSENGQPQIYAARVENDQPLAYTARAENNEPSYASKAENGQPLAYAARAENSQQLAYAGRNEGGQLLVSTARAEGGRPASPVAWSQSGQSPAPVARAESARTLSPAATAESGQPPSPAARAESGARPESSPSPSPPSPSAGAAPRRALGEGPDSPPSAASSRPSEAAGAEAAARALGGAAPGANAEPEKDPEDVARRASFVNVDVNVRDKSGHVHGAASARKASAPASGRRRHHHHHHHERRRGGVAGGVAPGPAFAPLAQLAPLAPLAPVRRTTAFGAYGDSAGFPYFGGAYGALTPLFMQPYPDFYVR